MASCFAFLRPRVVSLVLPALGFLAPACDSPGAVAAGVVTAAAIVGGRTPTQSIEQTYYVGIFDPLEQLPPAVYRLTVHGQASAISSMRFASGWVPASLVDGLGTRIGFDDQGKVTVENGSEGAAITPSRRMMMFGPEGFREAPRDHRLAIVMGSSPQAFFQAVDQALSTVVKVQQESLESNEAQHILEELYRLQHERRGLDGVKDRLETAKRSVEEAG